jgi:hypothetical protein
MGAWRGSLIVAALCMAGGCSDTNSAARHTLYRNSPFDYSLRVHWGTFDVKDKGSYNLNNCLMAARLLNANVTASATAEGKERDPRAGFWCESGEYREKGLVPTQFAEAFPTDV